MYMADIVYASSDWLVYLSISYGTGRKFYQPAILHVYSHTISILLTLECINIDVDMLNAVRSVLADVLSVSPSAEQRDFALMKG